MKKLFGVIALLPLLYGGSAQNLHLNLQASGNVSFPTLKDERFEVPVVLDANSAYTTYYVTPADVDRRTVARPGMEVGVGVKWKPENRWHFATGLRMQWVRYRMETEVGLLETGISDSLSILSVPFGTFYGGSAGARPSVAGTGQLSDNGLNTGLVFATLPLLLEFRLNHKINFSAGVELSGLLLARQTYLRQVWDARTGLISEQRFTDTDKKDFSTIQAGIRAGVQYRLSDKITLDASFAAGLSNLYSKPDDTNKSGGLTARLRGAALGLAYRLR